jgi:TolB-like protein/Tfp pilus assembly protein PilF
MRNFVSELRRRNVLRVAAAYALSAWIIIEAGSVLLPTFGAPDAFFQVYVIAVIAGFVVSVVLAWIFQVTPEGVKLDRDADRAAPPDQRARQKMNYLIIALLVVALTVSLTFNVSNIETGAVSRASIAVLPFASRSANPENRVFADGIHDDLLTRLGNVNALKVISRTSVMEYRDTSKNLRQIAEELGVESVLEGAVQRVGDNVRINLKLIDARTDEQIWAKTYDHRLTMENIFSVQSEISQSVADALRATLSPDERVRIASVPTSDLRAYRLYKEARDNLYRRQLASITSARSQFQEAVALDPEYADAHAGLAESIMLLSINHQDIPEREAMQLAQASIDTALRLDPNLADAYAIHGLMKATIWGWSRMGTENVEAEAAFRRAIALNPNHASAYMWFASLRDTEDRLDEAIDLYQRAMELDPLARIPALNLPMVYAKRGEHDAAINLWLEATRIHSEWPTVYQYVATHLWGLGRLDEAYAWYSKILELGAETGLSGNVDTAVMVDLGDLERARELLDRYSQTHPFYPFAVSLRELVNGDYSAAAEGFTRLIDQSRLPERYIFDIASGSALLAGDLETAKKYALAADPVLGADTAVRVDRSATQNAVKLAYIYQRESRNGEASRLLRETLDVIRDLPRLGTHGFGIRDVQIYALLGRREDAIAAFRDALDAGFRGSVLFDGWPLAVDPYLDSIRDEPRFIQMLDELESHLVVMRKNIYSAEAAGNLDDLRAQTETVPSSQGLKL